jgi:hypothetical protein
MWSLGIVGRLRAKGRRKRRAAMNASPKTTRPRSYYRPMPPMYIKRWVALLAVWMLSSEIPLLLALLEPAANHTTIVWTMVMLIPLSLVSGYFGAYLWGRLFWRCWLYRKYPPIEGFETYWWYPDRPGQP